jgi:hypothetical protein
MRLMHVFPGQSKLFVTNKGLTTNKDLVTKLKLKQGKILYMAEHFGLKNFDKNVK